MRIPLKSAPQEIIYAYNLSTLVDNQGWIYMRIEKGMCGFKQAGIVTNQELVKHRAPFGYHHVQQTPGMKVHYNRNTISSLVVNIFCVQCSSLDDAEHFLNPLRAKDIITVDMEGAVYIGIQLDWDYVHRNVTLSIPNYMRKALHIFQHILMGCK